MLDTKHIFAEHYADAVRLVSDPEGRRKVRPQAKSLFLIDQLLQIACDHISDFTKADGEHIFVAPALKLKREFSPKGFLGDLLVASGRPDQRSMLAKALRMHIIATAYCLDSMLEEDERTSWGLALDAATWTARAEAAFAQVKAVTSSRAKFVAMQAQSRAARDARLQRVRDFAIKLAKSGDYPSARQAAIHLRAEVWDKQKEEGTNLSEDRFLVTLQEWLGKADIQWRKR